jgi:hypothetical protein
MIPYKHKVVPIRLILLNRYLHSCGIFGIVVFIYESEDTQKIYRN